MESNGPSGRVTSAAVERATLRDRLARLQNGLPLREETQPPAPRAPRARHGDVGPDGDLVDELRPSRRLTDRQLERERRLAECITADSPELARRHLENVMRALERVPA